MDSRIDTDWFKQKLEARRMSQRQLAKLLGLDSSAVSLMFRGMREMKLTEASFIASLVGVPVDEVLHHAGVNIYTKGKRVSVAAILQADGEVECIQSSPASFDVPAPADLTGDDYIACQARTASSNLDHMDGWLMFMRQPTGIVTEAINRMCMLKIKNGVRVLATVKRSYQPDRYDLSGPFNANNVQIEWATPIEYIKT